MVEPDPHRARRAGSTSPRCRAGWSPPARGTPTRPSPTTARCRRRTSGRCRGGGRGRRPGRRPRPGRPARRRAAAARRGPARPGRRSGSSSPRSARGRRRAAPPGPRRRARPPASAWRSRSRLVRSEVSGVRSSWPASATSWRCRSREADSATSMSLNAVASRATSSSPSTGSGVRSSVRAICSTVWVSRRTGRSPLRATAQPAAGRADHAGEAEEQHHHAEPSQDAAPAWPGPGRGRRRTDRCVTGTATTR